MTRELPILMKGPLVAATQKGLKSETRRLQGLEELNKNPDAWSIRMCRDRRHASDTHWHATQDPTYDKRPSAGGDYSDAVAEILLESPLGLPGDALYVRETWYYDDTTALQIGMPTTKPDNYNPKSMYFRADGECCDQIPECSCAEVGPTMWRPSIHMPKWLSRIKLDVLAVGIERLQDIDEKEARAEGVERTGGGRYWLGASLDKTTGRRKIFGNARAAFADLWDSVSPKQYRWERNPHVWVVRYRKQN